MTGFGLDCSMTMAWWFEDEATPYSESVLDLLARAEAVVPSLWSLEVANVLLIAERKQRILLAQSRRFIELLRELPISVDAHIQPIGELVHLARELRLTSHDACYLDLALRTGLPLASLDGDLVTAAETLGLPKPAVGDAWGW
jgi:predicted nucleic acid-binding protein